MAFKTVDLFEVVNTSIRTIAIDHTQVEKKNS